MLHWVLIKMNNNLKKRTWLCQSWALTRYIGFPFYLRASKDDNYPGKIEKTRPRVNNAKVWLGKLFLIPGLVLSKR